MNLAGEKTSTKYKGAIYLPKSSSAESQSQNTDGSPGHVPRPYGCCSRRDEQAQASRRRRAIPSAPSSPSGDAQTSVQTVQICACFIAYPLHDGKIHFIQIYRPPFLQARLHCAQGDVRQDDAAQRHLQVRVGLSPTSLARRFIPRVLARVARHGQAGESG